VTEQVVALGPAGGLCGVFTPAGSSPFDGSTDLECGVLLLNAGVVHRVGPNRLYVRLARSLAQLGFPVLRFDFSGVGDSPARSDNPFFERRAVEEVQQAMEWMSRQHGCARFVLIGLCSGAEIAFKTACQDSRVAAAALINAPRYHTEPTPELMARVARAQEAGYYWRMARFDRRRWIKFFSARADYAAIFRAVRHKLSQLLRRSPPPPPIENPDVGAFADLLQREVRLLLLFSEGDWGFHYLQTVFGSRIDEWRARGNPRIEIVGRCDHTLTPVVTQERALRLIAEWASRLASDGQLARRAPDAYAV
jgi:pimeloyl-ACP methyl ester carboxylesterase